MKQRLASIVVVMMLALSTPAQAHENIFSMILKFHNMVHALEQLDKEDIEYAITVNQKRTQRVRTTKAVRKKPRK